MGNKQQPTEERFRKWVGEGGARRMREAARGEVYSIEGAARVRETTAGEKTIVSQLLAPFLTGEKDVAVRVKLTPRQRAVGNCFGAYTELSIGGGSSEFMKVKVDTSTTGSGGGIESRVHMMRMVSCAASAVIRLPLIRYNLGPSRSAVAVGPHKEIQPLALTKSVCVDGLDLTAIGLRAGWTTDRRQKGTGRLVTCVPDTQRKAIAEALRGCLDAIDDAWHGNGFTIPAEFVQVEVR